MFADSEKVATFASAFEKYGLQPRFERGSKVS